MSLMSDNLVSRMAAPLSDLKSKGRLSICDGLEAYPPLEQVFFQIAFIDIQSFYEV